MPHAPFPNNFNDHISTAKNPTNQTQHRSLRDDSPYGRGGWDPFHPSLERVSGSYTAHKCM